MNALFETAHEVQEFCDARGWQSCVIGGLAVQYWGEPRITRDVDLTLMTGFGDELRDGWRELESLLCGIGYCFCDPVAAWRLTSRSVRWRLKRAR